jgi:hypothetical protein
MDFITLVDAGLTVIGGLVVILGVIAPFTKSTVDDKILLAIKGVVSGVKVNKQEKSVLIQVK